MPRAAADDISIVLSTLGTSPGTVVGANLIANGNAEAGPGVVHTSTTAYIPGWSTAGGAVRRGSLWWNELDRYNRSRAR